MNWLTKLYETYENCQSLVGKTTGDGKTPLLPIAHSTQNAQIEIRIDIFGNFQSASTVSKENAVTIIPVTEDSGSRSSGISPHPLFDKLQYIAGDYKDYVSRDKEEYYAKYISQLEDWCNSDYGNSRVKAILTYLKKESVIKDLVRCEVLQLGEDGKMVSSAKIEGIAQSEAFVRINVFSPGISDVAVWEDKRVWDSFIAYYLSLQVNNDLCYATGKIIPTSDKHPAKIRNAADKAKLISGNDTTGFTFRGRFVTRNQAASVGYETSQKAHNVLKWLVEKQGYRNYEEAIVVWGTRDQKIPPVLDDTYEFFPDELKEQPPTTYEGLAKRVASAIAGYALELDVGSEAIALGMEAATPGRLSITYYRELNGSDFLDRLQDWHRTCIWKHFYKLVEDGLDEKGKPKKKRICFVGTPSPKDIAYTAFGRNAPDKLIKSTVHRLLSCIIDKAPIPYDLVKTSVNRTIRSASMDELEWGRLRSITCALVKKYRENKYKEEWQMEWDDSIQDINYLLGGLLAVADEIERYALREMKEERETNAIRLFERFAQNPNKTWKMINERLNPYIMRLGAKAEWLLHIKQDISSSINPEQFRVARNLDGRFVLGFDCQKRLIRDEIQKRKDAKMASKASLSNNN